MHTNEVHTHNMSKQYMSNTNCKINTRYGNMCSGIRAASAPAELGEEIHNVSRSRARTQVLLQARKLHVYGSGTFGAFWKYIPYLTLPRYRCSRAHPFRHRLNWYLA